MSLSKYDSYCLNCKVPVCIDDIQRASKKAEIACARRGAIRKDGKRFDEGVTNHWDNIIFPSERGHKVKEVAFDYPVPIHIQTEVA